MWKPSSVVHHQRKRAILVWVGLIVAILAYTIWQIVVVVDKQNNPSTTITVKNDIYSFPHVSVCLFEGYGCHHPERLADECVASALEYSGATFGDHQEINATLDEDDPHCVAFNLTQFEVPEGKNEGDPVSVLITMDWFSSTDASAETDYGLDVDIIIGGSGDSRQTTRVPYSRNILTANEQLYDWTVLTIGKTSRTFLSSEPITTFPALTISTTKYVVADKTLPTSSTDGDDDFSLSDFAIGTLYLDIPQGSYSLNEVADVNPKVIGTLLGSIGGFWELLLLTWGLFFISASGEEEPEPELRARDFSAPVKKLCQGCRSNHPFDNQVQDDTHGKTNGNVDVEGFVEGPK